MTVFVVQNQMRKNRETGKLEPRFPTIYKAETFGKLDYLLESSAHPFQTKKVVAQLHRKLETFCDDDYLLLTGNPSLIGASVAIASFYNDEKVTLLQWSGVDGKYNPIKMDLGPISEN